MADVKQLVLDVMNKKKKRMMMKDLFKEVKKLDDTVEKRPLKKVTTEMITEGTLVYWSSGSTTYFDLPGNEHVADGEQ